MKIRIVTLAAALCVTATGALAQQADALAYTDQAPYTDIARTAPHAWKGARSRADVLAELQQARASGTIPVGEAMDYPSTMKFTPVAGRTMARTDRAPQLTVLGGPPDRSLTIDGYQFVGGEAGYVQPLLRR
jgi:hypothetical protein